MHVATSHLPEAERDLLARAAQWPVYRTLDDLTPNVLQEVSAAEGIAFATALLWDRALRSPACSEFVPRIDALQRSPGKFPDQFPHELPQLADVHFAVAPGAFWKEHPEIEADGKLLREVASQSGCRTSLIPMPSTGAVQANAETILAWLSQQDEAPLILASLSKGGADVRLAMQVYPAAFRHTVAWINICGMTHGTPLVNRLLTQRWRQAWVRLLFLLRGFDFQMVHDLRHGPDGLLAGELQLPPHVQLINVVGFPLPQHMRSRRGRLWRKFLDPLGPNDGGVLLSDVCHLPGLLYPVWGADHYLQPHHTDLRKLSGALLQYVAEQSLLVPVRTGVRTQ